MAPRDPEEGGRHNLEWLVVRALDQNARRNSPFALTEVKVEPHSITAPPTGAEELCKRPTSRHRGSDRTASD